MIRRWKLWRERRRARRMEQRREDELEGALMLLGISIVEEVLDETGAANSVTAAIMQQVRAKAAEKTQAQRLVEELTKRDGGQSG